MKWFYSFFTLLSFFSNNAICQIEGDVRDKDDNTIKNAVIIVMDSTMNFIDSVRSDSTGYYEFTNLKPGKYFIQVKATGFQEKQYKNVVARKITNKSETEKDVSNATYLPIVLLPAKPKQ